MAEDKEQSLLMNFPNFKDEQNKEVIALTALFNGVFIKSNNEHNEKSRNSKREISIFDS